MKKLIGVGIATLLVALAIAAGVVVGAEGRGHAKNAAGQRAEFDLNARKTRFDSGEVRVGGYCKFISFSGTNAHPESHGIVIPEVKHLAKAGNVCEFDGPARMVVRFGNHYEVVHGICAVRVQDRRSPTHPGEPDLIKVRFSVPTANHVYEWAGAVTKGDIVVFERHID